MIHLLPNRKMKPLFKAPNTLELDSTIGRARGIQPERALEPAGCPLPSALVNCSCLIQKRRDFLLENNKADSVLLAFSELGECSVMITMMMLAMMELINTIIGTHKQCKQNLNRAKVCWDSRRICA